MSDLLKAFFFAHYWAWALIWAHVLVYFGRFARHSWRESGGAWHKLPRELHDLLCWIVTPAWLDVKAVLLCRSLPIEAISPYRYDKSHRLALFVSMSSLGYVFMGTVFATLNRASQSTTDLALNITFVTLACLAGLGHLLTPLESNPRRWRWFVLSILAWYPAATTAYWLYLQM